MITTLSDFNIRRYNTFGMDVSCREWIEYSSASDLPGLIADLKSRELPYMSIGAGSNLLFCGDYPGALLHSRILDIETSSDNPGVTLVRAGAGIEMDALIEQTASAGLWGLENLSGIPGEVGASAVQNVGAYGVEACDVIDLVECYDTVENRFVNFKASECGYGYRESRFKTLPDKGRYIVTYVTFRLSSTPRPVLDYGHLKARLIEGAPITPMAVREAVITMRNEKLPSVLTTGSAGSFFKNPVLTAEEYEALTKRATELLGDACKIPHYKLEDRFKVPAAWLIEQSGLKGYQKEGAATWNNQPLVIVNASGEASPEEIIALENHVIDSVDSKFGVRLHPEVEHVGLKK